MIGDQFSWFFEPSPATTEEIAAVEAATGHRLPDDYRAFAQRFAGGWPNEGGFSFSDQKISTFHACVGVFLNLKATDEYSILRVLESTEAFPHALIPVAEDGGGNHVCLDYRQSPDPTISFWHHGRRGFTDEVSHICETFTAFVDMLHEPMDDALED
jgi:cell wall assembly regulator SMI1